MTWREFAPTSLNADPISGGVYATLVGSDPLETSDGDTAYVETYLQSGDTASLRTGTFRLSPTPSGSFTRVKVAIESRTVEDGIGGAIVSVKTPLSPDAVALVNFPESPTSYETHEVEIDFTALPGSLSWVTPNVVMSPDNHWLLQNTTGDGLARTLRTTWLRVYAMGGPVEGRLAIDTHDHPFHVVGTRDPAMPYELVIDTGTQRLVEIIAGEEALATHELVIDETGRAGDPWTHCGLFRPI